MVQHGCPIDFLTKLLLQAFEINGFKRPDAGARGYESAHLARLREDILKSVRNLD
jgi:hypothetical protein